MAAMIAFQLMPVDIDGGFMRLAFIAGFGLAAGFFGARAMLWSALLIFLIAHRAALSGLNVDFSNPVSREQLWIMWGQGASRSEEHTSELQSLMRTSYAVFCLKKKKNHNNRSTDVR